MSADVWLTIDTGGDEPHRLEDSEENITYNLTPMLAAAGFPGHKALVGAAASEAAGIYQRTAERLLADRVQFEKLNPPNDWGDYDLAVRFCRRMAGHCARHPKAFIGAWL